MRVRIKVCCIASHAEAELAIAAGADAIGLVARMPSGPGPIADELIAQIAREIPPPVAAFMLSCEQTAVDIEKHVARTGTNVVQIAGHISASESAELAHRIPNVRRVQVIHVEDRSALELIDVYAPHVHAFLLDSGRPSASIPELGGTGRVHDWEISRAFVEASPRPVFLAGGLNAANVAQAIRIVRPYGVDLCSGVRTNGALDAQRLADFVAAVRRCEP